MVGRNPLARDRQLIARSYRIRCLLSFSLAEAYPREHEPDCQGSGRSQKCGLATTLHGERLGRFWQSLKLLTFTVRTLERNSSGMSYFASGSRCRPDEETSAVAKL